MTGFYYICTIIAGNTMKITLLTVGKTDKGWVKDGLDIYASRLKHYIPFSIIEIPELKNVSALSKDQIKTREGELILKNVRPADDLILLDERGKEHSSVEFAKVIQDKISYAGKDIVYVIGGAYGFSDAVYRRADSKISLSRMTFSHQMVRAIFVEQLYRAFTIMKGEPYHHE
jgi:23S rRNA (pseudouridine1915-N3)-methyltransferase